MKTMKLVLLIAMVFTTHFMYSQQKQQAMTNQEVVEKFLSGFNDPSKITTALTLLAGDYKFSNPMVQLDSKAAFIALAQEMGKVLTGLTIIRMSAHEDWVAVLYEFKSSIPGLESNFGTEWFRVENGIIKESQLIYDASEWRKFYAQMQD